MDTEYGTPFLGFIPTRPDGPRDTHRRAAFYDILTSGELWQAERLFSTVPRDMDLNRYLRHMAKVGGSKGRFNVFVINTVG